MDIPTKRFKQIFHDGVMIILAINSFQDIEFLLLARILVTLQQLKEHIRGIDKVLAFIVPIFLIVKICQLIKIMKKLIL